MKADTVPEQQSPPLEYTLEASSQEEEIFINLPLPRIESKEYYDDDDHDNNNGGCNGNDDVRQRDGNAQHAGVGEHGNSPFDEARADHATAGGGATFSPDLLAAELNDAKRNKMEPSTPQSPMTSVYSPSSLAQTSSPISLSTDRRRTEDQQG